jgi:hypothetical protein
MSNLVGDYYILKYWILQEPEDKSYSKVCDELIDSSNADMQAIGYILASLPKERGWHLIHSLKYFTKNLPCPIL